MGLETGSYISDLNSAWPLGSDGKNAGDNHLQLVKAVLKTTFTGGATGLSGAVTVTHGELNALANITTSGTGASLYVVTQSAGNSSKLAASTAFVANTAFSAALPAQSGNAKKPLQTDGSTASWAFENWSIITADPANAVVGTYYACNTTSAAFTVTLPGAPVANDRITFKDYAGTFPSKNLTIGRNGNKIEGVAENMVVSVLGIVFTLTYIDTTRGWMIT